MSASPQFDFEGLASTLLSQAQGLLPQWFPAGRFFGREFVIGDLSGTPGESLSINTQTGQWADFSTDDRGGDLISLYAAANRMRQIDAAKQLSGILGGDASVPMMRSARVTAMKTPESPEWDGIFPIPADAPQPPLHHPTHGKPAHIARYRNRAGDIIALVYRCEPEGQRKQVVPLTYCRRADGRKEWRWQSLPKPRSLYRAELLDQMPDARILLVEGEPKCDAANKILGDDVIVMSWANGSKSWKHADWSMLAGRDVVIWPDADAPGLDAAKQIADQLALLDATVRVLDPPPDVEDGWDVADAIKGGWGAPEIMKFMDATGAPISRPISTPANVKQMSFEDRQNGDLPIVYFDDIKPSVETTDFIEGILLESSAAVIYGESNSGKTFFATDMALHVAAGRTWRDREVEHGGVVYVALEGGLGFNNRIEAWRREIADDTRVTFAAIMVPINLLDPEADTERLIIAIRTAAKHFDLPIKLVVIDTLSRAMAGGNENAPDDMGALVMNMDRVRDATKAAVMFVHHSGKDQAKGARGHSLLRAAIDTEIEVVAEGQSRTATVVKQRDLEGGSAFPFTLKVVTLGENKRGKPVTSCVVEGSSSGDTAGAVLKVKLKGHPRRALEVLHDLLIERGKEGYPGVPSGYLSVPADWWRERFYDRTISDGADLKQDSRRAAFNRAATELQDLKLVATFKDRVWAPRMEKSPQTGQTK